MSHFGFIDAGFVHGIGFLGIEWKVVRRFVGQDPGHGQDQAKPGTCPTWRPRWCEGGLAVYARGEGD